MPVKTNVKQRVLNGQEWVLSNVQIAEHVGVNLSTVKYHLVKHKSGIGKFDMALWEFMAAVNHVGLPKARQRKRGTMEGSIIEYILWGMKSEGFTNAEMQRVAGASPSCVYDALNRIPENWDWGVFTILLAYDLYRLVR